MIILGKKPAAGGGGGGLTDLVPLMTPYNSTGPAGTNEVPGTFVLTAGRPAFVFVKWYSGNGVSGDTVSYITYGTQGRTAGTGTALSALSTGIVFSGRSNIAVYKIDAPANASNQSIQYSIGGTAPRAMVLGVFEADGANTAGASANATGATGTVGGALSISGGAVGDLAVWAICAQWASGVPTTSNATQKYLLDTGGNSGSSDIFGFLMTKLKTTTGDETANFTLPATESWAAIKFTIPAA